MGYSIHFNKQTETYRFYSDSFYYVSTEMTREDLEKWLWLDEFLSRPKDYLFLDLNFFSSFESRINFDIKNAEVVDKWEEDEQDDETKSFNGLNEEERKEHVATILKQQQFLQEITTNWLDLKTGQKSFKDIYLKFAE